MSRRFVVSAVVLTGWVAGLGVLVSREFNPSLADRLAEASLRVVPITTYYMVDRDGEHVGFASIELDTVPRTLQVTEYLVMDGPAGRADRLTDQLTVSLSRGLTLRDFEYVRAGDGDNVRLRGMVTDSTLVVERAAGADTSRIGGPAFPGAIATTVAMLLDDPRVGRTRTLHTIDPSSGNLGPMSLRFEAESLFVVVDSAVADSSGRWFAVHRDTVRAWRLVSSGTEPAVDAWVDAQGLVVESRRPGGLRLRRTAFEIAFENWRQADPSRSVSARADGNVVPSTWLASGAPRPVGGFDTLGIRLGREVPRSVTQWFGGRARVGSVRRLTRIPDARLEPRYALPTTERWQASFEENLRGEPMLEVNDPAIAGRATRIRGAETNPLVVIRRLAAWVHDSIRAEAGAPARSARDVMARQAGDAREFALVFTALARAAGIPARLVSGLHYNDADGRFYTHAWSYVYIGRWLPVDPMLGQVPADAAHLDFRHDVVDLGPDIARVLSRVELDIVDESRAATSPVTRPRSPVP